MGRTKSDGSRAKVLQVRVSQAEHDAIGMNAALAGMSVPQYVRSRLVTETPEQQAKAMAAWVNIAHATVGLEQAVANARALLTGDKE